MTKVPQVIPQTTMLESGLKEEGKKAPTARLKRKGNKVIWHGYFQMSQSSEFRPRGAVGGRHIA